MKSRHVHSVHTDVVTFDAAWLSLSAAARRAACALLSVITIMTAGAIVALFVIGHARISTLSLVSFAYLASSTLVIAAGFAWGRWGNRVRRSADRV